MSAVRTHVVELDVLRCLAAVMMIVNHGGYLLLSAADAGAGFVGALVFVGSFAPVVFFFATGFGVALSVNATGRAPAFTSTLVKAMLLVLADQLMFWRTGSHWGVNFLGFIGLSSLLLAVVARFRPAVPLCIAAIVCLLVLRYAIGPRTSVLANGESLVAWLYGVRSLNDMPYPPAPWGVYPLAGFVLGRLYAGVRVDRSIPRNRWLASALAAAALLFAGAAGLAAAGAVFFRWGTVSVAYFVLSLGVLAIACAGSMAVAAAAPRLAARLSLQGVASFAVIPLHYGVLELVAAGIGVPVPATSYLLAITLIAGFCLWTSVRFAEGISAALAGRHATVAAYALVGLVILSMLVVWRSAAMWPEFAWVGMVAGQLGVAGLLAVRGRRSTAAAANPNTLLGQRL
jgi:hypothetical protein